MKKLILLFSLFTLAAISYGQGNWTISGAKNRWANGMGFGNKDTSTYTNASDTNLLVLQHPGVLVYRHLLTDHWEILSYNSTVSNYKLISDSLFNAGYTRRDRTKQGLDSLGALKLNISDTAAMLSNRLKISDTLTMLSTYLRKSDTTTMLLPYLRKTDTSNMLLPYLRKTDTASMLSNRLKISDTASMLSNYRRKTTLINYNELTGTVPTWNQNTTGTAANITATSNSTITTLSSLSLPYSQLTGTPSLSGYVPYTGATTNVNLGSNSLTAGAISGTTGTFSGDISNSQVTFSNTYPNIVFTSVGNIVTTGANYIAFRPNDIEKVRITSGGNVLIGTTTDDGANKLQVSGGVYADSIIKSGGTSSQFLKADGSVDGSTYLNISDTSSMLSNYPTTAGYGLLKSSKILSVDTTFGYIATNALLKKKIDSLAEVSSGTGTVTSVATNTGSGITGGTITTTGTIAADTTSVLSTKLNVLNQLNKYSGTANTVTVGTIGTGIWQGTPIADSYISSASTWNNKVTSLTAGAGISIGGTTTVPIVTSTITQYTDALARASLSFTAGSGGYNSTTGVITIPTNNNQITNGAGYITGYTETDPIYTASSWYTTTNNSANWNTAYGWGNWAAGSHYIGTTLIANNRASASQTLTGVSIDGNAGTVTNGVYTTGSYADPAWITSLAYSKLTGAPSLSGYVPYTGATTNVNLGSNSLTAGAISGTTGTFSNKILAAGSVSLDVIANLQNNASNGYGLNVQGGNSSAYALSVRDYLGTQLLTINSGSAVFALPLYAGAISGSTGAFSGNINISNSGIGNNSGDKGIFVYGSLSTTLNDVAYIDLVQVWNGGSYISRISTQQDIAAGNASSALVFSTSRYNGSGVTTSEAMRINANQNILMGSYTDHLGERLQVTGTSYFTGAATFASSVTASSLIKSGGTSSQFLKADGSVDGNTYLTSAVTSLTGTTNQVTVSASTGAVTVSLPSAVTISGNMTAAAFFESSDKRLKNYTYQNTSFDGLSTVSFHWKKELNRDTRLHWGYLAQDVEKILPDQVNIGADGYKTVNYIEVLVYKIAQLEKRITQLENKNK